MSSPVMPEYVLNNARHASLPRTTRWAARSSQRLLLAAAVIAAVALHTAAQKPALVSPPSVPAKNWAVECAKNEEPMIHHPGSYLRYKLHEVDQKGNQLRDQIETPDGTVARLIARDGHPLTPEQDAAERSRLNAMIASPADFAHHVRRDEEGRKTGLALLKEIPDAMQWSYAEGQPQLPDHRTGDSLLVVLDFTPDPKWSAPDFESEILTGLKGRIWIDPQTRRMVHLEASLFRAVNVGWGLVAHVYPGGTVSIDQIDASSGRPIIRHITQQYTVRALLVKSVRQQAVTDTSDYRAVPAMSYQQAVRLLLDTPLPQQ